MDHHPVTHVRWSLPTKESGIESRTDCGNQRLGSLAYSLDEAGSAPFPVPTPPKMGMGMLLPDVLLLPFTCFMFSRLQRDLGTRLLISRRGVLLSPLARPGQFMKIKPIPTVQNSWRAKMARGREGGRERESRGQLSLMNFNHE